MNKLFVVEFVQDFGWDFLACGIMIIAENEKEALEIFNEEFRNAKNVSISKLSESVRMVCFRDGKFIAK